jgi:ABC-type bacteriocin/lantibiotic exporter with double-glycine peptidase domain
LANRTVILITHRPASLALADRVVRLEGGRLQDA